MSLCIHDSHRGDCLFCSMLGGFVTRDTRPGSDVMLRNRGNRPVETVTLSSRIGDPSTSDAAAASITPGRTERQIIAAFKNHRAMTGEGLCDDELARVLQFTHLLHGPTVKSARSRLTKAGLLVDSGLRRPSSRGRDQIVWRLK